MFANGLAGWNILFEMRQHDGKDDDTGVEVFPKPGSRTEDSLTSENDEEPEHIQDLKFNEEYELPFPLLKDAGEKQDAWLLKDSNGNTVLTLNFTVK